MRHLTSESVLRFFTLLVCGTRGTFSSGSSFTVSKTDMFLFCFPPTREPALFRSQLKQPLKGKKEKCVIAFCVFKNEHLNKLKRSWPVVFLWNPFPALFTYTLSLQIKSLSDARVIVCLHHHQLQFFVAAQTRIALCLGWRELFKQLLCLAFDARCKILSFEQWITKKTKQFENNAHLPCFAGSKIDVQ